MNDLDVLRDRIRQIDDDILDLVRRRNEAARRIGELKRRERLALQNFEVEKAALDHALETARTLGVHEETVREVMRSLIREALRVQERDGGRPAARHGKSALVVGGAGQMGQWFCRFLDEEGYDVFVDDPRASTWPRASVDGRRWDLVLVSTPPSTVPALLENIAKKLPDETLLVDIASVKGPSVEALRRLARSGKRAASLHPMFGPRTDLLMGKNVLALDAGQAEATREAEALFARTAAQVLRMPLEEHDRTMAEVLTLAHATSLVFNHALQSGGHTVGDLSPYASTTFRKQADVSREVAHENPDLYFEIQALNPASDRVLERLEQSLRALRAAVREKNRDAFIEYMAAGRRAYGGGR